MSDLDGIPADWPWRAASRFVEAAGLRWHVQQAGNGPPLLLVHGTGGSTHSWAGCLDTLATRWTVLAVDLPGHGFTHVPDTMRRNGDIYSLHGMSAALGGLLRQLQCAPVAVAGHSAGVPVLLQLCLDGSIAPRSVLGCNPALVAPPAAYTMLLAPLIGALVEREVVARGGALMARATRLVELMLASSGTPLTPVQLARYRWLCEQPEHVHAALTMMSRWDLPRLLREALALRVPLRVLAGTRDRWVPPDALRRVAERMPTATFETVEAGHLIPEEKPELVSLALQP